MAPVHPRGLCIRRAAPPPAPASARTVKRLPGRSPRSCPQCDCGGAGVIDTSDAAVAGGAAIWRRRRCNGCGHRWSTVEMPVEMARALVSRP